MILVLLGKILLSENLVAQAREQRFSLLSEVPEDERNACGGFKGIERDAEDLESRQFQYDHDGRGDAGVATEDANVLGEVVRRVRSVFLITGGHGGDALRPHAQRR